MKVLPTPKSIVLIVLSISICFVLFHSCTTMSVETKPATRWPISSPEKQGMQSKMLADMLDDIQESSYHIDSILIARNGHVVLDAYFSPFSEGKKHIVHGCATSIISALIGIAIDKGYIQDVSQPITDFFPETVVAEMDDLKKKITLENLLTMTSGLACRDSYKYRWSGLKDMQRSMDWAQHVLDLPMAASPGEEFEYCNGVSHLLSVIIQNATQMNTLEFAKKHLFAPLGILDIGWDTSPKGVNIGWGELRMTPHDMARFGWLFLNKGRWKNKQILNSDWVASATRRHVDTSAFDHYGYQWWRDSQGYYMTVGSKGQRIFVLPEKKLVAVFTGDLTGKDAMVSDRLFNLYVIQAATSHASLPSNTDEHARLNALVKHAASKPPAGYAWTSEEEGVAKDGKFIRTASPAFAFNYPLGSRKSAIDHPGQVMRMKTLADVEFSAFVVDGPKELNISDFGSMVYARRLKRYGSRVHVASSEPITLRCGTKAYRTEINWLYRNYLPLTTLVVAAYKEGKIVFVNAHPSNNPYYAEPIVKSLTFK